MREKAKLPHTISVNMIGHDSEFFLWDTKREEVVPSYKYYKPQAEAKEIKLYKMRITKKRYNPEVQGPQRPFWHSPLSGPRVCTYTSSQKTKIYRDGLAVEVGISPVTCRAFFWNDTRATLIKGEPARMPEHVVFTTKPWVPLTTKMISKFPEDLRVLGCSPSLDAYKESQKVVGVDPLTTMYRTCGSHLHMSFQGFSQAKPLPDVFWSPFIKLADLLIGVPFTYVFGDELERKRRKLYGQAGEFRFQPAYGGLEYRALSSRLWNHQATCGLFTGLWKYGLGGGNIQTLWSLYDEAWGDDIQQAINEVDIAKCEALLPKVQGLLKSLNYRYTIGAPVVEDTNIWAKLRILNQRGIFPDAGVWSRPFAPDAHQGWNDYVNAIWELPSKDPSQVKDAHYGSN